jgi:hypothetical protein
MHVKQPAERANHPRRSVAAIASIAASLAVLVIAAPSVGASATCAAPTSHPFPAVFSLRAAHTGCGAARAAVEYIQGFWESKGTLPGWFTAPRRGPTWHCRYQRRKPAPHPLVGASCVSGARLVTMNIRA